MQILLLSVSLIVVCINYTLFCITIPPYDEDEDDEDEDDEDDE